MSQQPKTRPVYRSVNRPLTVLGAERRLFFLALVMGAAAFNFFGSLVTGLLLFAALYALARWMTATDPQILRILLNSSRLRTQYDPAKAVIFEIERIPHA